MGLQDQGALELSAAALGVRSRNGRVATVVVIVTAASVVTLAASLATVLGDSTRPSVAWAAAMAVTLAVGELPLARVRVGHAQGEAYSVVEIAVLATLIALPLGWA